MLKLKNLKVGFYFNLITFIASIVAMFMFINVYKVFKYDFNKIVFVLTLFSIWLTGFVAVNALFAGEKPFWAGWLQIPVSCMLCFALILFINPCLSPIGIYFTVGNMGDAATNAIGVPRTFACAVVYFVAILFNLISTFMKKSDVGGNANV